jgi:hypothetical protein
MIGDHHEPSAKRATLLARTVDVILGTHSRWRPDLDQAVARHSPWRRDDTHFEQDRDRNPLASGDSSMNVAAAAVACDSHRVDIDHRY